MLPLWTIDQHPELRTRSTEIDPEEIKTPAFQAWIDDLIETMHKADGVGIAAPQTGKPVRAFIAMEGKKPHVVINPVVTKKSWRMAEDEEGCLRVPGKAGFVKRYVGFSIKGLDRHGNKIALNAKDFFARVLQHELDHLDGVLYIDRASNIFDLRA